MTQPDSSAGRAETPASDSESPLDVICRNALRLLDAAHGTPARLRVEADGAAVELEWPTAQGAPAVHGAPAATVASAAATTSAEPMVTAAAGPAVASATVETVAPAPAGRPDPAHAVNSPSVGTFYHAPEPGTAPFVQVGDEVEPGRQVGIVEVMKLMIPVEADRPGRVVEVLVPDGGPVEHGQALLTLAPLNAS